MVYSYWFHLFCVVVMNKLKKKKCKICKTEFLPFSSLSKVCSSQCAYELVKIDNVKKFNKETKRLKEKIKTKAMWLREAQAAFNEYVRIRDADLPCISCGRFHKGQYHAGHYLSVGACPELRFHPKNNNKQCSACNNHLSGNIVNYRISLINKIGIDMVEWLEGPHVAQKLTIEDIKEIKAYYKAKTKELKDEQ